MVVTRELVYEIPINNKQGVVQFYEQIDEPGKISYLIVITNLNTGVRQGIGLTSGVDFLAALDKVETLRNLTPSILYTSIWNFVPKTAHKQVL